MTKQARMMTLALAGALGVGALAPAPASASSEGRRNTALVLGGAAVYGIVKKNPTIAGVAGAGAVYSYISSLNKKKDEERRRAGYRRHCAHKHRHGNRCYRRSRTVVHHVYHHHKPAPSYKHAKHVPPGWSKGKKTGWGGGSVPPGHAKKWK